jgi:hypothetical protein
MHEIKTTKDIAEMLMSERKTKNDKRGKHSFLFGITSLAATNYDPQDWVDSLKIANDMIDSELLQIKEKGNRITKRRFVLGLLLLGLDAHKQKR